MKNKILTLVLTATMLAGCTKEKETDQPQLGGQITFGGNTYVMNSGIQQYYGLIDGKHFTNLYLYSDGIELTYENENLSMVGQGTVMSVELWKTGESIDGFYDLANDTVMTVQLMLNHSYPKDTPPSTLVFTSGTVTLDKNGENQRFTFNIRTPLNVSLTGSFTGMLLYFDYSK